MLVVVARQCTYPIWTEEFVFIEHSRKNPPQSLRIHHRKNTSVRDAAVTWAGRVNTLEKFRHVSHSVAVKCRGVCYQLPLPGLDHRCGAERQEAHHGAYLEPGCTAVGKPQDI